METLYTERFVLRPFTLNDAQDYFELNSDVEVLSFLGEATMQSLADAELALKSRVLEDYRRYGVGRLACHARDSGEFVGWVGLKWIPEQQYHDLGYRLRKKFWGRGIATETSKVILQHAFGPMQLESVAATVHPGNAGSIAVLSKLGFRKVREASGEEWMDTWEVNSAMFTE